MNTRQSKKMGRNELCSCGSGKKYKKCCLLNDERSKVVNKGQDISNVLSELKYKITDEPVDDNKIRKLPEEAQDKMEELYHGLHVNPRDCIKDLEDLVNRHPDIPQFYNYLYGNRSAPPVFLFISAVLCWSSYATAAAGIGGASWPRRLSEMTCAR